MMCIKIKSFPYLKQRVRRSLIVEKHLHSMELLIEAFERQQFEISEHRLRVVYGICALGYIEHAEELWIMLNEKKKISRAAVYSCLNILSRSGAIIKIKNEKGGASYCMHKKR